MDLLLKPNKDQTIISGNHLQYMYNRQYDYTTLNELSNMPALNNRLLCTFTEPENLDELLHNIQSKYTLLYNKIFVLEIKDKTELAVTYNIDHGNINTILDGTILVHRKKFYNCLYSINSLNCLIKQLNGGVLDTKYSLDWSQYKNSILLTQHNEFHRLDTKIKNIIEI